MPNSAHSTTLIGWALCLLGCTVRTEADPRSSSGASARFVPQRVTATVERKAARLVRVETEHEALFTTPEHPFATPGSGWIPGGQLVPGEWVVSAKSNVQRVLSVRFEERTHPVSVFNLTVEPSHAYLVGTDRLLVHNTNCGSNDKDVPGEDSLSSALREREEVNRTIEALRETTPNSHELEVRVAALVRVRHRLQVRINRLRGTRSSYSQRRSETARQALEAAQQELAEFEARAPGETEAAVLAKQRAALRKQVAAAQLVYDRAERILTWESELAALQKRSVPSEAERSAIEQQQRELRERLNKEKKRANRLTEARNRRAKPEKWELDRRAQQRRRRSAAYEADANRPRDLLEQLEERIAKLRRLPDSQDAREQIQRLTAHTQAMRAQVELRRRVDRVRRRLYAARLRRDQLVSLGKDSSDVAWRIAAMEREFAAVQDEQVRAIAKVRLLSELDSEGWHDPPSGIDQARVREFERELERELVTGTLDDRTLADLEDERGHDEPTAAVLERLETELEEDTDGLRTHVLYQARDVEARMDELRQLLDDAPSSVRDAASEASFRALQSELREERRAIEAVHFELVNQMAYLQTTQASSSSGATWQQRLIAIQEEQTQLREQWRSRMQARLDRARHQLGTLQRIHRLRDEATEAVLAREIALLTQELQNPIF